jgi:hypothetical protein
MTFIMNLTNPQNSQKIGQNPNKRRNNNRRIKNSSVKQLTIDLQDLKDRYKLSSSDKALEEYKTNKSFKDDVTHID